jgi:hypothetical protein
MLLHMATATSPDFAGSRSSRDIWNSYIEFEDVSSYSCWANDSCVSEVTISDHTLPPLFRHGNVQVSDSVSLETPQERA